MSETPSWLEDGNGAGAATDATSTDLVLPETATLTGPPPPQDSSPHALKSTPDPTPAPSVVDEADLPSVILYMRVANMVAAGALLGASIRIFTIAPALSKLVLACYGTCMGATVCCVETNLKYVRTIVAVNFGFLFNSFWRFWFYLIMASVSWAYGDIFGQIVSGVLVGTALYNTYILIRYPSYRKMRDKLAKEEDRRLEAKINQQVRKQAVNQLTK